MISAEQELNQLRADLRRMEIDYRRFLAHDLPTPPVDLQKRILEKLKRLQMDRNLSYSSRFLLQSLESRFNSLRDLFFRKTREAEEGSRPLTKSGVQSSRYDTREGITLGDRPAAGAVDALFNGLKAKQSGSKFTRTSFEGYLRKQIGKIQQKTGCDQVQFRLVDDDGKLKLKARPVY